MVYLSLYTRTKNSCVLLNYYEYDTLDAARSAFDRARPEYDADFYHIEYDLGELDTTVSKTFVCRDNFANSKPKADLQRQAEVKALKLLDLMPKLRVAEDKQSLGSPCRGSLQDKPCTSVRQCRTVHQSQTENPCERLPYQSN